MDENVKWLNDHGFVESNGAYELQAIPGVLFRVRWDGIQWQCQAIIKDMFPFIECHGNTAKKAVAREAYNVSTSCLAQKSVVNHFLDKNLKQRAELNEEINRQEKDIRGYDNIVTVLNPFLEEGVFFMMEGEPVFAGRDGNRLRCIEKPSVESKDKEKPISFSAREDVEVHEPGLYPTLHVRRNDTGVYDIWSEGYQATCEFGRHRMVAHRVRGNDFIDAVERWYKHLPNQNDYGSLRVWTDEKGERHASLWGCELFDNEADAARSFG